jgi:hypothetical protein
MSWTLATNILQFYPFDKRVHHLSVFSRDVSVFDE